MDDRGANIDLLFRNGLKDYEVLPPAEVWDTIQPVVKKPIPFFFRRFLRAAAMTTTISTISLVAWMLSRENAVETFGPIAGFNIIQSNPLRSRVQNTDLPVITMNESVFTLMVDPVGTDYSSFEFTDDPALISEPVAGKINRINLPSADLTAGTALIAALPDRVSPEPESSQAYQDFNIVLPGNAPSVAQKPVEKWSISALASPTYYSKLGAADVDPVEIAAEDYAASYSGGLSVAYRINKRLSIQTGVYYASHGQQIQGINSFSGFRQYTESKGGHNFELPTTSGTVVTSNADVFLIADGGGERLITQYTRDIFDPVKASLRYIDNSLTQNFSYLQMPVMLRYKLIDRNLDFNIIGGLASDFLIGNSAYAYEGGNKYRIGETEGVNSLAFSSSLGMGMEYNFSGKISLNLEPTFRYFINPFQSQSGPRVYPYSFGVFSGFSYRF